MNEFFKTEKGSVKLFEREEAEVKRDISEDMELFMSSVCLFCSSFENRDGEQLSNSLESLVAFASKYRIPVSDEFAKCIVRAVIEINVPQLRQQLLYFILEVLHGRNSSFTVRLLDDGLLLSLFRIMDIQEPETMETIFKCLINVAIDHPDHARALLQGKTLDFFTGFVRQPDISENTRALVPHLLSALAQCEMTEQEVNDFLMLLRVISSDSGLSFGWSRILKAIEIFIGSDARMAKYVMLDKEFHIEVNNMLLLEDTSTVSHALGVLNSYYTLTSQKIPTNTKRIVDLCSSSDTRVTSASLTLLTTLISRDFIDELAQHGLFQVLKDLRENGTYSIKKEAVHCMIAVIRTSSDPLFLQAIEFNFMEDLVAILDSDIDGFDLVIGAITKMLRRHVSNDHLQACWTQFLDAGAIPILENLASSPDTRLATRASRFLDVIANPKLFIDNQHSSH